MARRRPNGGGGGGGRRRGLQTLVDERPFDDADGLSVEFQRRYAVVLAGEQLGGGRVAERTAVQEPEQVTVAREMVADHGEAVGRDHRERAAARAVQHVVPVEPKVPDPVFPGHGQALHRVDLVVQHVQAADVRESGERVRPDHAQVRVLHGQHVHVAEPAERVRFQRRQVHERQLQQAHRVQSVERVRLQLPDARRQYQVFHVGQTGKCVGRHLRKIVSPCVSPTRIPIIPPAVYVPPALYRARHMRILVASKILSANPSRVG